MGLKYIHLLFFYYENTTEMLYLDFSEADPSQQILWMFSLPQLYVLLTPAAAALYTRHKLLPWYWL